VKDLNNRKKVLVTGSTGVAALRLKGRTIHRVLGLGDGRWSLEEVKENWRRARRDRREEVLECEVIIIDEISMISRKTIDMVRYRQVCLHTRFEH